MSTRYYSKYFIIAAICSGVMHTANGQFVSNYKKAADGYYAKGDFNSAAIYYEKYIGVKPGSGEGYDPYLIQKQGGSGSKDVTERAGVLYRLAESYRKLTYYTKAEDAYQKVTEDASLAYPLARYWYGVSLRANGKYKQAQQELEKFIASYPAKDEYKKLAIQELENCKFIQQALTTSSKETLVNKFDSSINQEGANYAAGWAGANTLVFTSTRGTYTNRLYSASAVGNTIGGVKELPIPVTGKTQQGVASFTADGQRVYFTVWETGTDGKKTSAIYSSDKKDSTWSAPVLLNNNVNAPGYNARQPQVTADGKYLLFASDKPGGSGKFDIWYAPIDKKGNTGKAINAGKIVNTPESEEAPFYHEASGSLVFASNGRTGMGGFDLYAAKGAPGGTWQAAENLGYPVNSVKDDIYFVAKQDQDLLKTALISSDRSSACCLELFAVTKTEPVAVTPPAPERAPEPVAAVPVQEEPKVEVVVENNKALLEHVLFDLSSYAIDDKGKEQLKAVAAYLVKHPEVKVEIGAHTDGTGVKANNLKLSQQRAEACVNFLLEKGIDASRLMAKGYGSCCPLEAETTADGKDIPEARQKNRRMEMKVIN